MTPEHEHYSVSERLRALEHGAMPGALICECELVTRPQIEAALASYGSVPSINDLRRDLRIGMGPCQGGFCSFRTAAIRHEVCGTPAEETVVALREFARRRFGGARPLLWGHNLRQAMLDEIIARRMMGRVIRPHDLESAGTMRPCTPAPAPPLPKGVGKRVVVIGVGLAGLTAALVAARAGAKVHVVAAGIGRTHVSPGYMEVLDTCDGLQDAVRTFIADRPGHPLALAGIDAWHTGKDLVLAATTAQGLPYYEGVETNALIATLTGLTRRAALLPASMAAGALRGDGSETLVVGFEGWRDFYPSVTADILKMQGFAARSLYVTLPPHPKGNFDAWPMDLARRFEQPDFCAEVARQVRPAVGSAARVSFPAVLGLYDSVRVVEALEAALGVPVFEINTLPPSVPGMRLYEALRRELVACGVRISIGPHVTRGVVEDGRMVGVAINTAAQRVRIIRGDAVILASGGLLGGGIESDRAGAVWEILFNLPLMGPVGDRDSWFLPDLFPPEQLHPVHQIGVRADADMRPLGDAVPAGLYVCGRLLGGYDPLRDGTSEAVDIATGYKAALSALRFV